MGSAPFASPLMFGPFYHFVIHLVAYGLMMCAEFTPENLKLWCDFLFALVKYLPCGGCAWHFTQYLIKNPPDANIHSWEDVWHWTVDFHNAVNVRTGKRVLTRDEAKEALLSKINGRQLEDIFDKTIWMMLTLCAHVFTNGESEADDEEHVKPFVGFLTMFFELIPFGRKDGILDRLLDHMEEKGKFGNIEEACKTIWDLYNIVAKDFDTLPLSHGEWYTMFEQNFTSITTAIFVERAQQQRKEDHTMIKKLQDEIHSLKSGSMGHSVFANRMDLRTGSDSGLSDFEIVSIVIASILLILLVAVVYRYYKNNKKPRRKRAEAMLFKYEPLDPMKEFGLDL